MNREKRSNFTIQMTEKLELPKDVMLGAVLLHITGRSQIEIENFNGIQYFSSQQIILKVSDQRLEIAGSQLEIKSFYYDQLIITGKIEKISYIR